MILTGQFNDIDNNVITVTITKNDGNNNTVTIGENGLYFDGDPISIETDMENTFEPIIRKSCTINLLTKNFIGDYLWASNAHNIRVEIKRGNDTIFYGFVEPNTFSQPFVSLDEFSINCIDVLSALQYYNYKDATIDTYKTLKANSATVTFRDLILDSISNALQDDISSYVVLHDRSKGLSSASALSTLFQDLGISESYLYGETYDDVWTSEEVVRQTLQYLSLHIIQHGKTFYIFDWDTLKTRRNTWYNLVDLASNAPQSMPQNVTITGEMHGANDTSITISDVYNQVSVKCELENIENVITSPLDNDSLTSPYSGKQLYMREYISPSSDNLDFVRAFHAMVSENGTAVEHDEAKYVDWYLRVMRNPNWQFHTNNGSGDISDQFEQSNGVYINQWKIPKYVKDNRLTPAIIKMGSVERKAKVTDDSPISKVNMSDYLFVSVNGNEIDDNTNSVPTPTELQNHAPIIEYIGGNAGVYSPSDDETTNYLVFSGSMLLQPIVKESAPFKSMKTWCLEHPNMSVQEMAAMAALSVKDSSGGHKLYTRKFFKMTNPTDSVDETNILDTPSLQPWCSDNGEKLYEYEYAEDWGTQDLVSKLPVLECELIIGNKRLIETDMDEYGHSTFQWVTLGNEPVETYEGQNYPITTFTLGVNPKIDDYIIGTEFKLQNTVDISMNIDAEGTAIPIKKSDNLSGALQFRILGTVNSTWNQVVRRHPTWFRHTSWSSENKIILAHLENVILKDFKCQIFSDNAHIETDGNDELIYVSDETDRYISKHEDTEFKFITQPSIDIIEAQGLTSGANLNAVTNLKDNTPLTELYKVSTHEYAKPEEHFVNQYYTEYHIPRIEMQMTVHNGSNISWRNTYVSTPLNKTFYVVGINEDVRNNKSIIKLKSMDI